MSSIGYLNDFLSWKVFQPLSRLSYCVYLIHFEYMNWYYAQKKRKGYCTHLDQFTLVAGISMIVYIMAFFLSTTVEASFLNLEKLIFFST